MEPRFRMFAGPNGSGKTSLFNFLKNNGFIHTEIYVNADHIEQKLFSSSQFSFNAYRVKVNEKEFREYALRSGLLGKMKDPSFIERMEIKGGILKLNISKRGLNSYFASVIASYLAEKLIESKQSFCFETVLSHVSKLNLMRLAKKNGFKTYLYFIVTDNWRLNIERVKLRVRQGGHDVDNEKIELRYFRSLKFIERATTLCDSAFLIDNSIEFELMTELKSARPVYVSSKYPKWLRKYFNPA